MRSDHRHDGLPTTPMTMTMTIAKVVSLLALMAPTALMPMPPTMRLTHNTGHIDHPRRRWRCVNHTGWRSIDHLAVHPHSGVDRKVSNARVHRHRRLDHHGMCAAHLGQTQAQQAEQRDGS